ncbi:hypothetical protein [Pseudonocardia acidicola]|uniref:Integral membrane protein n=1 Tax=Pseudonocardia acidicola TaxID=2724939 RepID=A0ABX1S5W3_9PSEU|nr:hypothetical protein [Pseudonocardia acidicola]NMH96970.1 hypothetical protein [Pseudonocardia acidicola]
MKELTELVDLPDPAVQPLVHPLDLPESRRPFRTAHLLDAVAGPAVSACLAALVWFASTSAVVPLVAFVATAGLGALARRHYTAQAWSFIPRRRQDRDRASPLAWELAGAALLAVALGAVLLLVAGRLTRADVPVGAREFTLGAAVAVAVLMAIDLAVTLLRSPRRAALALPAAAVVAVIVAMSYPRLHEGAAWAAMVGGAGTMLLAAISCAAVGHANHRRASGSMDPPHQSH